MECSLMDERLPGVDMAGGQPAFSLKQMQAGRAQDTA
jgi:hypothetical protein